MDNDFLRLKIQEELDFVSIIDMGGTWDLGPHVN